MIIQNYHFAGELARTRVQELQHEAYVAKLARQGLASKSGAFFGRLAAAFHFTAAPRSSALRFEYGDVGEPAIGYLIGGVDVEGDAVRVSLNAPGVACKVKSLDIQNIPMLAAAPGTCCAPNENVSSCCG